MYRVCLFSKANKNDLGIMDGEIYDVLSTQYPLKSRSIAFIVVTEFLSVLM